ncbi:hypothetical protein ELI_3409 [Eubacterium callanderi]|uniref:Uncharacterized protein n=1 Tax=Eubacterium callanderi TaxID=53442 RepID=E3GFN4_9FIRM|nr:hypothetical protein ELI_3409 [Eubacterium callanderi]
MVQERIQETVSLFENLSADPYIFSREQLSRKSGLPDRKN